MKSQIENTEVNKGCLISINSNTDSSKQTMKNLYLIVVIFLCITTNINSQATLEADINQGSASSYPGAKTVYDGKLYFTALDSSSTWGLWSFDGVNKVLVVEYAPINGPMILSPFLINYNGKLYFSAPDGNSGSNNSYLWSYDGSTAQLEVDYVAIGGTQGVVTTAPVIYNGKLFFKGFDVTDNGRELWSYNGTDAVLEADIRPGSGHSDPSHFALYNDKIYFSANSGQGGTELYSFDGVNAIMEADIAVSGSSNPRYLTAYNNNLYFQADGITEGVELWSFDAVEATIALDINPDSESSWPTDLVLYDGWLYFSAYDDINGFELWCFNGTTAYVKTDILSEVSGVPSPRNMTVYNDKLYFQANDGVTGKELWSFDGDLAVQEADIRSGFGDSEPAFMTVFDNKLFFTADDFTNGDELWSFYDGTIDVSELSLETTPSVYPNPSNGQVQIMMNAELQNVQMLVFNPLGKVIHKEQFSSVNSIDFTLPKTKGVYFIQLLSDDGQISSHKVLRE